MNLKNVAVALVSSLGLGVAVGVTSFAVKEDNSISAVKAATTTCTFRVSKDELSGWGGVGSWGLYAWHSSTPITDSLDNCYSNMTLNGSYYTKSITYSDSIDGVILLFKQNSDKWKSQDITVSGGFKYGGLYTLSYKSWISDSDGNGHKVFSTNISDNSSDPVFSLIGSYGSNNWNADDDMTINTTTKTATLNSVVMEKGDAFKIRYNHAWDISYGWSNANGHISITDPQNRGESCLADANDGNNIEVLHNGTYNFSLNYSTGVLTITGTRAASDSAVAFEMFVSRGGAAFAPTEMALKGGSETEYMVTTDLVAGDKIYFKFGANYYHYSDFKENEGTTKGTQFGSDNDGNIVAFYNANYTIYVESATGSNHGAWFQYNSVSSAQIRANVISYATYFNNQVGGACKDDGSTTISELQTAWTNVKTRYDNSPDGGIKTSIAAATDSDENANVATFVEKYARVYYLRGSSLSSQGGDFLSKGITPRSSYVAGVKVENNNSNSASIVVVIITCVAISAVGGYFLLRKKKEN